MQDLDARVRALIYEHFAASGRALDVEIIAARTGAESGDVRAAFQRLRQQRVLFLEQDGGTIRMAPPFSAVPTQHQVQARGVLYHANCAWDALGILAALRSGGTVLSECAQSREPLRLAVGPAGPEPSEWVFHCLVPARRWWDDLVFT